MDESRDNNPYATDFGRDDATDDGFGAVEPQTNTLGIVGFVLAFCLSPIGLIVSLIAALSRPRGFAVAGIVIGLVGTAIWGVVGWGLYSLGGVAVRAMDQEEDQQSIQPALETALATDGAYPGDLAGLGLSADALEDPWGNSYAYEVVADGSNFLVTSAGPDGVVGSPDDIEFDRYAGRGPLFAMFTSGGGRVVGAADESDRGARTIILVDRLTNAARAHEDATGAPPDALTDIEGITPEMTIDGWGNEIRFTTGGGVSVVSAGADGRFDTDDDIDSTLIRDLDQQMPDMGAGSRP